MPELQDFREGEPLSAAKLNRLVRELRRLGKWQDTGTVNISDGEDGFRADITIDPVSRHFYTTGTISAASDAGSSVTTASLTQGFGTARPCLRDPATGIVTPDQGAADETIWNDVEASITSGIFVKCSLIDAVWVLDLKNKCS